MDRLDRMDALLDRVHALEAEVAHLKSAAPPAIPEDVRDTIKHALAEYEYTFKTSGSVDEYEAERTLIHTASTWLDSAPVASDKAVCPKCGEDEDVAILVGRESAYCKECGHTFTVQVLVISPPREVAKP